MVKPRQLRTLFRIPPEVARRIGYYVYLYVDPRSGRPFYVGKGKGSRALSHIGGAGESKKARILAALRKTGHHPQIDILAHSLPTEDWAFRIEAAAIDLLGLDTLANQVRGWHGPELGRMTLRQLITQYKATPARIVDPVILIRLRRRFSHAMSEAALYDSARGVWRLDPKRARGAKYAFAVFEGVVREVYRIHSWHPAGTTRYLTRPRTEVSVAGRWEFVGERATKLIRRRYVDHSVGRYLRAGLRSPIVYVGH